jgi:hypothetical protein
MRFTFAFLQLDENEVMQHDEPMDFTERTEWRRSRNSLCLQYERRVIEEIQNREHLYLKRNSPSKNTSCSIAALGGRIEKLPREHRDGTMKSMLSITATEEN